MKQNNLGTTYTGGCHCGGIRFRVIATEAKAIECNCSICRKKGFLHLIVPSENFILLRGQELLTVYTFNTHTARHTFCKICGIHSFYHPRSHPNSIDVNIRCVDGNVLSDFAIEYFDGENWEKNVEKIRSE